MSRYDDCCGDEYSEARYNLWQANLRRALRSPRGQRSLRDLYDALLALPEKRLISGALCTVGLVERVRAEEADAKYPDELRIEHAERKVAEDGEAVCAIGALLWWRRVKAGATEDEAFASLPLLADFDSDDALHLTAEAAKEARAATYTLAWSLAYWNDEEFRGTPEERWAACLAWVESKIVTPAEAMA